MTRSKRVALVVALLAGVLALVAATAHAASGAAGTVTGDKAVTPADIACNGQALVTVTLAGQNGIAGAPADVELVLDRSGSMGGTPIADLIVAANQFVDILDESTDGVLDGTIANGTRIGVVSFNQVATVDTPLTSNATLVHNAINALVAGGNTNHQAAIQTAQNELAGSMPTNAKKMIIFTDGNTTVGGNGQAEAAAARAAGTEIFSIGLGSVNVSQLNGWATDLAHVFITPTSADLTAIFNAIGAAIVVPAATNVTVVDTIAPHFGVSGAAVSKGAVSTAGNVLTWTIDKLSTETVTLTYVVTHDATQPGGVEAVNSSITYADSEAKPVSFPSPTVNVRGCAKAIALAPPTATNELGTPGQTHTVVATVTDDFGDPVAAVPVTFSITAGPNAGPTGTAPTDLLGTVPFTYTALQGLLGLGTDDLTAFFTNGAGQVVSAAATKVWRDTTPPTVQCTATTNPSGENVPTAGANPKSGQNPDGFYLLDAKDAVDGAPMIFVADTGSSYVAGGFASGTQIKLVQAPGATPGQKAGTGVIDWKLTLKGDASVYAVDASGNASAPVSCAVPPPPK